MKKSILAMAAMATLAAATGAQAGNWSINCTNSSCQATQGAIIIQYSAGDPGGYTVARLSGISGLPFSAEDFQSQEKALNMSVEKSISKDKRTSAGMDASGSVGEGVTGGGKIGNDTSRSNGLTRKKSQSVSQSAGGRVTVNHTLGFFNYYADNNFMCNLRGARNLQKYMCAAETLMDSYAKDGGESVKQDMYGYLFSMKSAEIMPDIDIMAKTTADNSEMQAIKYASLTSAPMAGDQRWKYGYQDYQRKTKTDTGFAEFNKAFLADKMSVMEIMKPGQTAKKLEAAGKHDLALAKYTVDAVVKWDKVAGLSDIKSLSDKYLFGIALVREAESKKSVSEQFAFDLKKDAPAVNMITVPIDWTKRIMAGVLGLGVAGVVAAVFVIFRKRKAAKPVIPADPED